MPTEWPSSQPEQRPEVKTDQQRLAEVRQSVDEKTRQAALKNWDPAAIMKLNIAWAKQYPEHDLAKKIQEIATRYPNISSDPKAAEEAVRQSKALQAQLGINWSGQDGIMWRGTLSKFENIQEAEEKQKAQEILANLDNSLYGTDLAQRTEEALNKRKIPTLEEIGATRIDEIPWRAMGLARNMIEGTKVQDARWTEYTVKRTDDWKTQYVAKGGEVFELRDKRMVSLTKELQDQANTMKTHLEQAKADPDSFDAMWNMLWLWDALTAYKNDQGEVVGIQNQSGQVYNFEKRQFEAQKTTEELTEQSHQLVLEAIKKWKGTKYQEADGRYFEVKQDEGGNLTAFRSSRTSWAAEYYNADTKKWEENSEAVKTERVKTASRERLWEFMEFQGRDLKKYWEITLSDLDSALQNNVWQDQTDAIRSMQTIKEDFSELSPEDKKRLSWVKLADYRRMTEDSAFAAQQLATNQPTSLPAWLGEDWSKYQRFDNKIFVFRDGEDLPKVIGENGRVASINEVFNDAGRSYDLPDGKELRVSINNNWGKTFYVAENGTEDPKWVLAQNWKLEKIKKT